MAATLDELEFENGGEAELFFVATRPGTYEYGSRGMMERGVVGKIIVESGGGRRGLAEARRLGHDRVRLHVVSGALPPHACTPDEGWAHCAAGPPAGDNKA